MALPWEMWMLVYAGRRSYLCRWTSICDRLDSWPSVTYCVWPAICDLLFVTCWLWPICDLLFVTYLWPAVLWPAVCDLLLVACCLWPAICDLLLWPSICDLLFVVISLWPAVCDLLFLTCCYDPLFVACYLWSHVCDLLLMACCLWRLMSVSSCFRALHSREDLLLLVFYESISLQPFMFDCHH